MPEKNLDEEYSGGNQAMESLEKALNNSKENQPSEKIERSELWNEIFEIINQIPMKETNLDCVTPRSATTEVELLIKRNLKIQ